MSSLAVPAKHISRRFRFDTFVLASMAIVSWLVRLWYQQFERIDWDGYFYLIYARNIAAGKFFLPSPAWTLYSPMYPTLIAGAAALGVSFELAAIFVSQLAGVALIVVLSARLAQFSRTSALVLGLLLCFNNVMVRYSNAVLSESLFTFWLYLLLMSWVTAPQTLLAPRVAWLSGLLIALLVITRSVGLIFVVPYLLVFGLAGALTRKGRAPAIALALTILILAVYILYTHQVAAAILQSYGIVAPNYAQQEIGRGLRESGYTVASENARLARFAWDNRLALGRMWLQKMVAVSNLGVLWQEGGSAAPVLPAWSLAFAGVGFYSLRHRLMQAPRRWLAVVGLLMAYCAAVPLFTADPRYYVPLVPGVLVLAAIGLADVGNNITKHLGAWQRLAWQIAWPSALIIFVLLSSYAFVPHGRANADNPWIAAGGWAQAAMHPSRVLVEHPAPAYFMGAEPVWLQVETAEGARRQAQASDIDLAAIQCSKADDDAKQLRDWANAGWLLLHRTAGAAYDACIFQLR